MALIRTLLLAAFLVTAEGANSNRGHSRDGYGLTLGPINAPHNRTGMMPSHKVNLQYGSDDISLVNVSLAMQQPSVLLESIASVSNVDCTDSSVAVTFSSLTAFTSAFTAWSSAGSFVLVTNHLGDCDTELERGFFLADSVQSLNASLTVIASSVKTFLNETAGDAEITFSSIPTTTTGNSRRAINWDPSLSLNNSLNLASTTLYTYAPYVTVTANSASLYVGATLSGKLKYSVLTATLEELYVDLDTALEADLALTVDVSAPYNTTATFTAPTLSYALVDIPGIITLGPELGFGIGVDIAVDAAVVVAADVGMQIADGNVHIDFRDSADTTTSGWIPTYKAAANISEKAVASINPYFDVTVELACEVLGGLLDLSIGLDAQPRFNNEFRLSATQELEASRSTASVTQPTSAEFCSQGVSVTSEFVFNLIATVTQFWSDTIYSVTLPIATECYSF